MPSVNSVAVTERVKETMQDPDVWGLNPDVLSRAEIDPYPEHAPNSDHVGITLRFDAAVYFTEVDWLVHTLHIEDCLIMGGFSGGNIYNPEIIVEGYIHKNIADPLLS